jgi:tetratricopeptide (TPR) repeat protein
MQLVNTIGLSLLMLATQLPVRAASAAEPVTAPPLFVAPFNDDTGGRIGAGVADAIRDLLQVSLAANETLRLVDRDDLDRVLGELQITLAGASDPAHGVRAGRLLGAERLLCGKLMPDGKGLLAVVQLIDVRTAVVQKSLKVSGAVAELPELTTRLAREIATALDLPPDAGAAPRLERDALAAAHYLRGLNNFHAGHFDHAILELAISDELNLGNPALHYWSGRAYEELKAPAHAVVEFQRFIARAPRDADTTDARARLAACTAAQTTLERDAP